MSHSSPSACGASIRSSRLPLVFITLFLFGIVLYQVLFRFVVRFDIEKRIKNSLLISFGLVLVLQATAVRLFTADERTISTSYSSEAITIGMIRIPIVRLGGLVVAVIAALAWSGCSTTPVSGTRCGRQPRIGLAPPSPAWT